MSKDAVDKIRQRMKDQATKESNAQPSPDPPKDGGSMSGDRLDPRGEGSKDRSVAAGPKSMTEKQVVAEEKTARAKAEDVEDSREETSGDERHDLVIPSEPNIPPTIVAERLRLGQNPTTGEPWTKEERMRYDRETEQARQRHARAVRESEQKMRKDQAEAQIQPTPHVPVNQLTERQKKAMQDAQDQGRGPIAQARIRDLQSPEELGKREAEADQMTEQEKRRQDAGVDEDIERKELGEGQDDQSDDDEKDADELQAELDEKQGNSK